MSVPRGYLLTWTTYGTWLPGDKRGWVDKHCAAWHMPIQEPDSVKAKAAMDRMKESAVVLCKEARSVVEAEVRAVCLHRGWLLHAVSARSNHVHAVVSAGDVTPGSVLGALKANTSRKLREASPDKRHWWTEGGSTRYLNDETSLTAAIRYVQGQDVSWQKNA